MSTSVGLDVAHVSDVSNVKALIKSTLGAPITAYDELGVDRADLPEQIVEAIDAVQASLDAAAASSKAMKVAAAYNYNAEIQKSVAEGTPPPLDRKAELRAEAMAQTSRATTVRAQTAVVLNDAAPAIHAFNVEVRAEADKVIKAEAKRIAAALGKIDTSKLDKALRARAFTDNPVASLEKVRGVGVGAVDSALEVVLHTLSDVRR